LSHGRCKIVIFICSVKICILPTHINDDSNWYLQTLFHFLYSSHMYEYNVHAVLALKCTVNSLLILKKKKESDWIIGYILFWYYFLKMCCISFTNSLYANFVFWLISIPIRCKSMWYYFLKNGSSYFIANSLNINKISLPEDGLYFITNLLLFPENVSKFMF
jgi:hypothetical protein